MLTISLSLPIGISSAAAPNPSYYSAISSITSSITPPKTILTWVNGIGFNLQHMNTGQTSLSSIFGNRPVHFCHNPTAMTTEDDYMGYIGDLTQAGTQKLGRITDEVDALVKHLRHSIQKVGPRGKVIHIAHSQGALITYLASKNLTKSEMKQMEVICFGGAASMHRSPQYPFARCVNYYSVNDPLLFLVPTAAKALRSGFLGMGSGVHMGNNNGNGSTNNNGNGRSLPVMQDHDPNDEPEFVFLTPRGGDPIQDHGLLGPTYIDALRWEGNRYKSLYLPLWHPLAQVLVVYCGRYVEEYAVRALDVLVFQIVWKRILLPYILFVLSVNTWVKENICVPFFMVIMILLERLKEVIRILRGEDVYVPVTTTTEENPEPDTLLVS